jgi:hypothetical protein
MSSPGRGKASDVLGIALHHRHRHAKFMSLRDEIIIESLNLYGITEGLSRASLPILVVLKHPANDPDIELPGALRSSSETGRSLDTGEIRTPRRVTTSRHSQPDLSAVKSIAVIHAVPHLRCYYKVVRLLQHPSVVRPVDPWLHVPLV